MTPYLVRIPMEIVNSTQYCVKVYAEIRPGELLNFATLTVQIITFKKMKKKRLKNETFSTMR